MAFQLLNEADTNFNKKLHKIAEVQYTTLIETYESSCNDAKTQK